MIEFAALIFIIITAPIWIGIGLVLLIFAAYIALFAGATWLTITFPAHALTFFVLYMMILYVTGHLQGEKPCTNTH